MLKPPVQVLVADDHPLVRAGVVATLQPHQEFSVVGEARCGHELLEKLRQQSCDLLILDLEMEGPGIGNLVRTSRKLRPKLKILILSCHTSARFLDPLRKLSIDGYVLKDEAPGSLLQAMRVVAGGSVWFSHEISRITLELAEIERLSKPNSRLTVREQQVFDRICEAKDNQTIAEELKLSKQTVRRYATIIYEKLGVKNRVEAILCQKQHPGQCHAN